MKKVFILITLSVLFMYAIAQTDTKLKSVMQQGHSLSINAISYHPDGKTFLSFGGDNIARLWSKNGLLIKTLSFKYESWLEYSRDGKYLVGRSTIYDLNGNKVLSLVIPSNETASPEMSLDGKMIAVAMDNLSPDKYKIKLLDIKGQQIKWLTGFERTITSMVFSQDGKQLAVVSGTEETFTSSMSNSPKPSEPKVVEVMLINLTGEIVQRWSVDHTIKDLKYSPDGTKIIAIQKDGKGYIWNVTGDLVTLFTSNNNAKNISCSSDNEHFIIGGYNTFTMHDYTGAKLKTISGGERSKYSPDSRYILSYLYSSIMIYDSEGTLISKVGESKFDIDEAGFIGNGSQFYSGSTLWSLEGKRLPTPLESKYFNLKYNDKGEYMTAMCSKPGGKVGVYDLSLFKKDGTEIKTFPEASFTRFSNSGIVLQYKNSKEMCQQYDFKGVLIDSMAYNQTAIYSPNDQYSAVYEASGVKLYDKKGKLLKYFEEPQWLSNSEFITERSRYDESYVKRGVTFSPSGKYMTIHHPRKIQIWEVANQKLVGEVSTGYLLSNGYQMYNPPSSTAIQFIEEEKELFIYLYNRVIVADVKGKVLSETSVSCGNMCGMRTEAALSTDEKLVAIGMEDNRIYNFNAANGATVGVSPIQPNTIVSVDFSPNSKQVLSKDFNGNTKIWKSGTMEEIAQFIPVEKTDFAIITPDNYYLVSKNASKQVHFVAGDKTFSFENFDLLYNRPDIVLEKLGFATPEMVNALKNAYLRRLRRMGFTERDISLDAHLPEIELTDKSIPLSTDQKFFKVNIKAIDTKYLLDRINVSVNGVPIYGTKGLSVKELKKSEIAKEITVELTSGRNVIQYSVMNEKGAESTSEQIDVKFNGPVIKPNLFVIAIGVSDYLDKNYNLTYAAKDANDIADMFSQQQSIFEKISVLKILNTDANIVNILKAKEFLMKSKVEDQVVLFAAGHGVLDESLNFYFATTDIDFNNPSKLGLPYEELDNLLDGIPQRKKLMLIDACNSGEVDKENSILASVDTKTSDGTIASRGFKTVQTNGGLGLSNSFELMQNMFTDLTKGSGAMVISSASGTEFALESDVWKNGVFTFSFLEGLKTKNADLNKDQNIKVLELRDYVIDKVSILTNGRQHPTSRKENSEFDFVVW